ncbi:MAG: ROK family protein [Candidatus Omnitrophica bacterium]|nr:ROK family protein [Candidatus Omnitrophota bacterium]
MKNNYWIGIDLGGTKIAGACVDSTGQILHRLKIPTPRQGGVKKIVQCLEQLCGQLIQSAGPSLPAGAVGIGIPGIVDAAHRNITVTPNLNISGLSLAEILEKNIRLPVIIGNDVNLGLLGEQWLGAAQGKQNVVGLFPGTGIGGAIIIKNELVEGSNGAAAELGHILVHPDGPLCTCGNRGCLEALTGRWAIERDIRAAVKQGEKTVISKLLNNDLSVVKSSIIKEALRQKDPLTMKLIGRLALHLGRACVSLRHIFDPDAIVFGGGLIEACPEHILPPVQAAVKQDPLFRRVKPCDILTARLSDDAVLLGAVALAHKTLGIKLPPAARSLELRIAENGLLILNGKPRRRDFYIRADGKIKKRNERFLSRRFELTPEELEKICKKKPALLIIGTTPDSPLSLTKQSEALLRGWDIACKVLPRGQAIELYRQAPEQNALFIQNHSS